VNLLKSFGPAATCAVLFAAPLAAQAGLIIELTDGASSTFISDNGAGDIDGLTGGVAYFGSFKTWEVTFAMGTSAANPFEMHLTSSVAGNAGDGLLTIKLTNTDLVAGTSPLLFAAGGGGFGATGSTGSWAAYVDDSNTAFGTDKTVFTSDAYTSANGGASFGLSGLYSATLSTTFDYTGVTVTAPQRVASSLDVGMKVPEPSSILLAATGLLALATRKRRRKD
jgi:hypothetical protein